MNADGSSYEVVEYGVGRFPAATCDRLHDDGLCGRPAIAYFDHEAGGVYLCWEHLGEMLAFLVAYHQGVEGDESPSRRLH